MFSRKRILQKCIVPFVQAEVDRRHTTTASLGSASNIELDNAVANSPVLPRALYLDPRIRNELHQGFDAHLDSIIDSERDTLREEMLSIAERGNTRVANLLRSDANLDGRSQFELYDRVFNFRELINLQKPQLEEGQAKEVLKNVFHRIGRETNALGPLESLGASAFLANLYSDENNKNVTFEPAKRKRYSASYRLGKIRVHDVQPPTAEVLCELALGNGLPTPLCTLLHEFGHMQEDTLNRRRGQWLRSLIVDALVVGAAVFAIALPINAAMMSLISGSLGFALGAAAGVAVGIVLPWTYFRRFSSQRDFVLCEAFPRFCEKYTPVNKFDSRQPLMRTVTSIIGPTYPACPSDPARALDVMRKFEALYLLKVNLNEIATLCRTARFNHFTRRYKVLDQQLEKAFQGWGVEDEPDRNTLISFLRAQDRQKSQYSDILVSQIVCEELRRGGWVSSDISSSLTDAGLNRCVE